MKLNILLPTILAAGAFALPLHAQNDVPGGAMGGTTPADQAATPAAATTPAAVEATPAASSAAAQTLHFGGMLSAVDTTANTITVQNKKQGPRTFQVTDSTKVTKTDGSAATLADLKAGDHVHGAFKKTDDGKMELLTLKIGPAAKKSP